MIAKYYEAKWKCAFWYEFNKQANELMKHPENIEKKILPYLANLVHESAMLEKQKMANGTYMEK
jgi:hypothetical protein